MLGLALFELDAANEWSCNATHAPVCEPRDTLTWSYNQGMLLGAVASVGARLAAPLVAVPLASMALPC